jgi:hypothetical protein
MLMGTESQTARDSLAILISILFISSMLLLQMLDILRGLDLPLALKTLASRMIWRREKWP